jgi:hypothetical protein
MTSNKDSIQLTTFSCTNKECNYRFQAKQSNACNQCGEKTTCKRLPISQLNEYIESFQDLYAHQCTDEEYTSALMERWKQNAWMNFQSKEMIQLLYYYTNHSIPLTKLSIKYTQQLLTSLYQQATH